MLSKTPFISSTAVHPMQERSRVLITNVLGSNQIATEIIFFFPILRHWKQLEKCSANDSSCHL